MLAIAMNTLEQRRRELGMSRPALARRSGVSLATVNRVLGDGMGQASFKNVVAIAEALGMPFRWAASPAFAFRQRQAKLKSKQLAAMVQGTSALEGQAVEQAVQEEIEEEIECRLLAGSKRKLWG
jgi:transcriptional regulator with XRE-family HTH domain